jgi:hypothetical protein
MRLVSFSLYGSNSKYIIGAYENAEFVSRFMPGWNSVFYIGAEIGDDVSKKLMKLGAVVKRQEPSWHTNGMFWRFKVFHDFLPEYAIIRDTDSRISEREIRAIAEWVESGKIFHIMRDHPHHNVRILGGMWGGRGEISHIIPPESELKKYSNERGQDQAFLGDYVYPRVRKHALVHDSFFWINPTRHNFPVLSLDGEYVGESIDENNSFDEDLRRVRTQYLLSYFQKVKLNLLYLREHSLVVSRIKKVKNRLL